ncbi:hypothetical protein LGL55_07275 [Clostridium tagluense]|uniref:hypothetical protein n=1 Tax=Clostridium TaxID=1485 RepID=UPI0013E8FDA9|nr:MULTISPECIES: hypothetical protein [Clostridium]MBW9157324.1 hypothetical protein [Clostridium tagluense]MBZ9623464.1 hypothetical protein [Clostridium sp. FP2]MCB2310870.1 hypothetical protein [Clostridium tagluense]MCB2315724.1 hypothetical protein [Clostridium tagluense]MCB2320632.1 hypothetical protein [Clostridium tagluense]
MVKTIKKISCMFIMLFLVVVVFILMAQKFDWSVDSAVVPFFLIIFILTASCMLIVSISGILEIISKDGKKSFCKKIIKKWLFFFVVLYVAAFLKNDVDILIVLGSSFAFAILSYYYTAK